MILDKLDRLEPREKMWLTLALFVVLAFGIDRLMVNPVAERCRDLDLAIRAAAENLELNKVVLQQREQVHQSYAAVAGDLSGVGSAAEQIDAMKARLDELATQSGVKFYSREQMEPRINPAYTEYAVDVGEFEASMEGLVRFLSELPKGSGMMRASRLSFTPDRNRADTVRGAMLITKLVLPVETPPGS
jgi:hypothetical protein